MKLNNIINKFYLAFVVIVIFSCNKEYLEVTPTDKLSDDAILADSTLFEAFVINRYQSTRLQDKEAEGTDPGFGRGYEYALWSSLSDESIYNNNDFTWVVQQGQLSPENTGITGSVWGRSYRGIRECNYGLANMSKVKMSDARKKLVTAELKFIRAFRYQDLIRNYGGVVLLGDKVFELSDDFTDPAIFQKSSLQECLNYAIQQLDEAAADLPSSNGSSWLLGRATKGAALALKSRLTLYAASPLYTGGSSDAAKWQAAAQAAKDVMGLGYGIYQGGYREMFNNPRPNGNNEIIFARYYSVGDRHVPTEISNGPNGFGGWGGNVPLQNMVDAYDMNNGKAITDPTSGYDPQNPYANRDPRFYETILYNGAMYRGRAVETFTPKGQDSREGRDNWNASKTGYYLRKFVDEKNPIDNPWDVAGLQPWIYFRYAEILLNYAEAQNEAVGPDQSVYDAINSIRARKGIELAGLPAGLTQAEMREKIRAERRVELAFEEHRFYDVRRWKIADVTENVPAYGIEIGKAGNAFTYSTKVALDGRKFETKHYWMPIPRADIQASGNKLLQNEGY
jgi:starch-binding outer membrane protein, SusD/RagB family